MRILVVSPYLPSRHSGAPVRLHGLVSKLAKSHDVSLLTFKATDENGAETAAAFATGCQDIVTVPYDGPRLTGARRRALQFRSLFSRRSYLRHVCEKPSLQVAMDRLTERHGYDIVQVEHCFMAHYAFPVGPAVVLDEHNIEYELPLRTVSVTRSLLRKTYDVIDYLKLRAEEERSWRTFDACAVTSPRDEATIKRAVPDARTMVVPNAVDPEFFSPSDRPPEPQTLLFFGTIAHHPNADGILFFLREVMPLLKRTHPSLRLFIVGPAPTAAIRRWAGPDIVVTGAVDDVRPYLQRAGVVIAPLRIGGGTRLKILEAMAMGRPVVSTSLGAEGLAVTDGKDILLADTAPAFAAQVRRLLDDADLGTIIGLAGRRLVEGSYQWSIAARKLEALYQSALLARSRGDLRASPVVLDRPIDPVGPTGG